MLCLYSIVERRISIITYINLPPLERCFLQCFGQLRQDNAYLRDYGFSRPGSRLRRRCREKIQVASRTMELGSEAQRGGKVEFIELGGRNGGMGHGTIYQAIRVEL